MTKVRLITGGSRGIGAATARAASRQGYDVAIAYVSNAAAADAVAADVMANGAKAITVQCDVSDEDQVRALFDTVDKSFDRLDAVVNSAGIVAGGGPIESYSARDIDLMLRVNVLGTILCSREAMKRMGRRNGGNGGSIVNVSSVAARLGAVGFGTPYAASKGAVDSFTIGLGREGISQGVRVNAVTPGPIATDMNSPDRLEAMAKVIPAGRVGQAQEVADAILFLSSEQASFITSANIDITGGR
jgi:NAD(P)-dependent dehydrogenase (short-subunit alcohol dehydrogenase family)